MSSLDDLGDQTGQDRAWDVVTRTTRAAAQRHSGVDAVIILPLLRSSKRPGVETLLVSWLQGVETPKRVGRLPLCRDGPGDWF